MLKRSSLSGDLLVAATAAAVAPAAASATTTAAITPATAAAATTAAARAAGTRFVHGERAPAEVLAVKRLDRRLALGVVGHRDEPESTRAAGFAIGDDRRLADLAVLREEVVQVLIGGLVRQVADVDV